MGYGDNLMATGLAKGARIVGKRAAFGDGSKIIWDHLSKEIFANNPNIAPPGSEGAADLQWLHFYRGCRIYNFHDTARDRWAWNYNFRPVPGQMFFSAQEDRNGERYGEGFTLIEPNVSPHKMGAANKDWGFSRYQMIADQLSASGCRVAQFLNGGKSLERVAHFQTNSFRDALAILSHARLYIGPEGGLHHGAAAVGVPGVVIFGGWIPHQVTGYAMHVNLGNEKGCGLLSRCEHCRQALDAISIDQVYSAAIDKLKIAA